MIECRSSTSGRLVLDGPVAVLLSSPRPAGPAGTIAKEIDGHRRSSLDTRGRPDAVKLARELYGLEGRAVPLPSEYDDNFRLEAADGTARVLKVMHPMREAGFVDMQCAALEGRRRAGARPARTAGHPRSGRPALVDRGRRAKAGRGSSGCSPICRAARSPGSGP